MFIPQVSLDFLKDRSKAKFETLSMNIGDVFKAQRLSYLEGKREILKRFNESNCNLGELQTIEVEVKSIIRDDK